MARSMDIRHFDGMRRPKIVADHCLSCKRFAGKMLIPVIVQAMATTSAGLKNWPPIRMERLPASQLLIMETHRNGHQLNHTICKAAAAKNLRHSPQLIHNSSHMRAVIRRRPMRHHPLERCIITTIAAAMQQSIPIIRALTNTLSHRL